MGLHLFSPVNIAKYAVMNRITKIPKKVLIDIVGKNGKKSDIVDYVVNNWIGLSELEREKIFLHTLKRKFAPKKSIVKLGRWGGYKQVNEGSNYPW